MLVGAIVAVMIAVLAAVLRIGRSFPVVAV
jgi:hypothetical protein